MPRIPDSLGTTRTPRPQRGVVGVRSGVMADAAMDAAQMEGQSARSLGAGLRSAGDALFQRQMQIDAENDKARLQEADVALSDRLRGVLRDPDKGFLRTRGKFAVDGHKSVSDEIDTVIRQVESGLQNERQRNAFKAMARARRENALDTIGDHVAGEFERFKDDTANARIESLIADGLSNYGDPAALEFNRTSLGIAVADRWKSKGSSDEAVRNEVRATLAAFDQNVKKRRLEDTYDRALAQSQADPGGLLRRLGGVDVPTEMTLASPDLIAAVVQQESGGRTDAVSPKGALGVMQLMPATAREIAKKVGLPFNEKRLVVDPEYNKALGTAYLNEQLERYGGNVALALAAYNAGPAAVDDWVRKIGDPRTGEISTDDWVAQIPFDETGNYVSAVLGRAGADPELAELGPEHTLVLMGKAEARQRELQAQARAAVEPRLEAEIVALQRGEPVKTPVSDGELQEAYGADGITIRRQRIDQARKFGVVASQIAMQPIDEAAETVEAMRPADTDDPLYVQKLEDFELAQRALAQSRADRDKDPAAYVLANSQDLRDAWAAADHDPAMVENAMAQTLELQHQIGIPERQAQPLPDNVAKAWLASVVSAETAEKQVQALRSFLPEQAPALARRAVDQLAALPGGAVYAVAAGLSLDDPELAHDVLAGQRMQGELKGSKGIGGEAVRTELDAMLGNLLAFNPRARGAIIDATLSLYAKAAVEAGAAGDDAVSADRLETALNRLTGGVIEFRDQQVIPPAPGMDDGDMEDLLDRLTDADLARAMFATGETVSADQVRDAGALQSAADGVYLLLIDGLPVVDGETMRPFTLDLRPLMAREAQKPAPVYLAPPGIMAPNAAVPVR